MNKKSISYTILDIPATEHHKNINEVLLKILKEKFEGRCYANSFIKSIDFIKNRSSIVFSKSSFPSKATCDVLFEATVKNYEKNSLINVTVSERDDEDCICRNKKYIANFTDSSNLYKPGDKVFAVILASLHKPHNICSITVKPYKPLEKPQAVLVNCEDENSEESQLLKVGIAEILKELKKLKTDLPIFKKYWHEKIVIKKHNIYNYKYKNEKYFIIDPKSKLELGEFDLLDEVNDSYNIRKISVNFYKQLYDYCNLIYNYVKSLNKY